MSEEEYNRQLFRRRIYVWALIITLLVSGNILVYQPSIEVVTTYIPGMVNGLVSATSILVAIALFTFTHIKSGIEDSERKRKYHLLAILYLLIMLVIFSFGIMIGYSILLRGELEFAWNVFITIFAIIIGIVLDMSIVSGRYSV